MYDMQNNRKTTYPVLQKQNIDAHNWNVWIPHTSNTNHKLIQKANIHSRHCYQVSKNINAKNIRIVI